MPNDHNVPGTDTDCENCAAILRALKDPVAVHNNMLRGIIAPITMMQCAHVHGEAAVTEYRRLTESPVASTSEDDLVQTGHIYYFPSAWGHGYVARIECGPWNGHEARYSQPYYTRRSENPKFPDEATEVTVAGED